MRFKGIVDASFDIMYVKDRMRRLFYNSACKVSEKVRYPDVLLYYRVLVIFLVKIKPFRQFLKVRAPFYYLTHI